MKKSDLTCPECGAGFRRIELTSKSGTRGEYIAVQLARLFLKSWMAATWLPID